MKYIIIETSSASELASKVSILLTQGWTCQGGVSVCQEHGGFTFYQALIK